MKAAVVQLNSSENKSRNLEIAKRLVRAAAADGAQLVVLPELFNCLGPLTLVQENAESLDGPTATAMRQLADDLSIYLCAGSICERAEIAKRAYNTSLFFGPDGVLVDVYRKQHLFDVQIPGEIQLSESSVMLPGRENVVSDLPPFRIGFATCYDLRFPELFRNLTEQGATVICLPAAFTYVTGKAHWETLVRARAIENQCYFLAANQVGEHSDKLVSFGHSMIDDPWGSIEANLGDEHNSYAVCAIDFEQVVKVRERLPALLHRRIT